MTVEAEQAAKRSRNSKKRQDMAYFLGILVLAIEHHLRGRYGGEEWAARAGVTVGSDCGLRECDG